MRSASHSGENAWYDRVGTDIGATRTTFVIGLDGVVAHVIHKVTPRTHDDEVLAVLEQLAAT